MVTGEGGIQKVTPFIDQTSWKIYEILILLADVGYGRRKFPEVSIAHAHTLNSNREVDIEYHRI